MKISHIEHLGIAVQSIEESLPFFTEHNSKVARQGQQGRSPCSILHRGWCCQRVGRSQREGRTSHRPGTS